MTIWVNQQAIKQFNFSGGESHVSLTSRDISEKTQLKADLFSADDIMSLLLTVDAIRRIKPDTQIHLNIPYFPYARQDRVCNPGEALSAKVMADLINQLNCASVNIADPHSDVTPALLNHCKIHSMTDIIINSTLRDDIIQKNLTLVSPDAGAEKKVQSVAKQLACNDYHCDVICASKVRDTRTGNIVKTEVTGNIANQSLIILDDICDGGRTFIELAKALKQQGAGDIYLYVTHGIFSKGFDELEQYFKHIYCYHTVNFKSKQPNCLTVLQENHDEH